MPIMATDTILKRLRTELYPKVAQEDMARACHITLVTYRKIENGGNTSYSTAQKILKAINGSRIINHPKPLPPIERVEDLGLNIV